MKPQPMRPDYDPLRDNPETQQVLDELRAYGYEVVLRSPEEVRDESNRATLNQAYASAGYKPEDSHEHEA